MRHPVTLDSAHPTAHTHTDFQVEAMFIINPTAYTVAVRIGASDPPPGIAQADFWCPPANAVVMPVAGNEFAFSKVLPQLAAQPQGMPDTVTILLIANEPLPNLGSLALSTVSTFITNPQIPVVNVPGTAVDINVTGQVNDLTATIQNARLSIVNAPGDTLGVYAHHPDDAILSKKDILTAASYPNAVLRTVFIPNDFHSLSLTAIDPNISSITVIGQTSGFTYLSIDDARVFLKQKHFVVPFYPDIDTVVNVTTTLIAATTHAYTLVGHRTMQTRSATAEGFSMTHINPPRISMYTGLWYDTVIIPPYPIITLSTYAADPQYITTVRGVFVSMDGTTNVGDVRYILEMLDIPGTSIVMRLCDVRSQTAFQSQYINVGNLRVPPAFTLRIQAQNIDVANRRLTAFPYVELEKV